MTKKMIAIFVSILLVVTVWAYFRGKFRRPLFYDTYSWSDHSFGFQWQQTSPPIIDQNNLRAEFDFASNMVLVIRVGPQDAKTHTLMLEPHPDYAVVKFDASKSVVPISPDRLVLVSVEGLKIIRVLGPAESNRIYFNLRKFETLTRSSELHDEILRLIGEYPSK